MQLVPPSLPDPAGGASLLPPWSGQQRQLNCKGKEIDGVRQPIELQGKEVLDAVAEYATEGQTDVYLGGGMISAGYCCTSTIYYTYVPLRFPKHW